MSNSSLITLQLQRTWLMLAGLEYMLVDLSWRAELLRVFCSPSGVFETARRSPRTVRSQFGTATAALATEQATRLTSA